MTVVRAEALGSAPQSIRVEGHVEALVWGSLTLPGRQPEACEQGCLHSEQPRRPGD